MKRIVKLVSFVAGLGAVSWLLKDRLVPVPDPSRLETPPPFKRPTPATPAAAPESEPVADDDLTAINGIGPSTAAKLAARGITTFAGLAAADPDELADEIQGASADQVRGWQDQARNLG